MDNIKSTKRREMCKVALNKVVFRQILARDSIISSHVISKISYHDDKILYWLLITHNKEGWIYYSVKLFWVIMIFRDAWRKYGRYFTLGWFWLVELPYSADLYRWTLKLLIDTNDVSIECGMYVYAICDMRWFVKGMAMAMAMIIV